MLSTFVNYPSQDSAVVASATYGQRYITERKLPDKAIDLLDEAASRLRLQQVPTLLCRCYQINS